MSATASVNDPVGWQRLTTGYWGREPVRLAVTGPGRPVVDPERSFAAIRTASAPFRAGTLAFAVPDVRFRTTAGRLRAPGPLLPGPQDADVHSYLDRMASHAGHGNHAGLGDHAGRGGRRGWLLAVEHPLLVDFQLWSAVRDLVSPLWRQVGWPVVPVTAELVVGHGYTRTDRVALPPEAAGLVWVLAGSVTVRLWREPAVAVEPELARPERELTGGPGDLLYWPADFRVAELFSDRSMALKLSVSGSYRATMAMVKNLLAEHAQQTPGYPRGRVPYLPDPPPVAGAGPVPAAEPIQAIGALLHRLLSPPEPERSLRWQWAARRSAAGLEPVPPPLAGSTLDHADRIQVTTEIVRLPDGADRAVWVANGHLLPVAGAAAERIRSGLPAGAELGVSELCRAVGAGERNEQVLALLRRLHRLRAIRPVPGGRSGA